MVSGVLLLALKCAFLIIICCIPVETFPRSFLETELRLSDRYWIKLPTENISDVPITLTFVLKLNNTDTLFSELLERADPKNVFVS